MRSADANLPEPAAYYHYNVYGIGLRSQIALSLPQRPPSSLMNIELQTGSPAVFSRVVRGLDLRRHSDWYHYAHLDDRSTYVRWMGLGEFLVSSDGRRIICAPAPEAPMESFQVYLLGQALSFALVKSGFEPLHATAVSVGGGAIAFLGKSGFGKSSLAASFLASGHKLVTDDLLLLERLAGGIYAHPGPPRIKLFPGAARRFLGCVSRGIPMNSAAKKQVVALDRSQVCEFPLPIRAIYTLAPPGERRRALVIRVEALSLREAFVALVGHTFNRVIVDRDRLQRQLAETSGLLGRVAVRKLSFPRGLNHLAAVREAILADLEKSPGQAGQPDAAALEGLR